MMNGNVRKRRSVLRFALSSGSAIQPRLALSLLFIPAVFAQINNFNDLQSCLSTQSTCTLQAGAVIPVTKVLCVSRSVTINTTGGTATLQRAQGAYPFGSSSCPAATDNPGGSSPPYIMWINYGVTGVNISNVTFDGNNTAAFADKNAWLSFQGNSGYHDLHMEGTASVTITDSTFQNSGAKAVYVDGGTITINGHGLNPTDDPCDNTKFVQYTCAFVNGLDMGLFAGGYNSGLTNVSGCSFRENTGSAIGIVSSPAGGTISSNGFCHNHGSNDPNASSGPGGQIWISGTSFVNILNNYVNGSYSNRGGLNYGIEFNSNVHHVLSRGNIVRDNTYSGYSVGGSGTSQTYIQLENENISQNGTNGIGAYGPPRNILLSIVGNSTISWNGYSNSNNQPPNDPVGLTGYGIATTPGFSENTSNTASFCVDASTTVSSNRVGNFYPSPPLTFASAACPSNFYDNGVPELAWQNNSDGSVTANYYGGADGSTFEGSNSLNTGSTGWRVRAFADFDGNGVPDLVWQNDSTSQVTVHYYGGARGATFQSWNWLNSTGSPGWHVVGAADFNGDGVPDLIWQNDSTRQVTVNYYGGSGGATLIGWNWLHPASDDAGWTVVGAADFDGNGVPDLIWQNDSTRQVTVHYYGGAGGAVFQGSAWLESAGNPGWHVVGAADFNGDGSPDLVWQNDSNGQVTVHYYGGSGGAVPIVVPPWMQNWNYLNAGGSTTWHVAAVAGL